MWAAFVVFIFFILLTTLAISIFLYVMASKVGLDHLPGFTPLHSLGLILFISLIIGTVLSAVASKKLMKFIYGIRDATSQVALGNFSIQLEEYSKIPEVNILLRDFNKMVKDLGSIETLKDDFITSVSHEIKTPIAAIEGCVELLKEQTLTEEELKEYINLMDISVKRLSGLIANILRLSKLENQEILSDQTEFSLDEQIRQAILLLENKWNAKNINLNICLNPALISTNEEILMQVWINLIDNAIKFSETGGNIHIESSLVDGKIYVKVIDDGAGMSEDTVKHMFQKFYQGDKSRSGQGNGLGLALVKRILELIGGEITVDSELGKGCAFTVALPSAVNTDYL